MMSTKCKFCTASIPFYKRLLQGQNKNDSSLHIVAAFPSSFEEVNKFVEENQFSIETVSDVNL
jgi:3-oxoacyl-ACP reductase-like protein